MQMKHGMESEIQYMVHRIYSFTPVTNMYSTKIYIIILNKVLKLLFSNVSAARFG